MKWLIPTKLCIQDECLDAVEFGAVEAKLKEERYKSVDIGSKFSIWQMNHPLNPTVGTTMLWPQRDEYRELLDDIGVIPVYPTGTAYDYLLKKVNDIVLSSQMLAGKQEEVAGIIATVYRYQPGSRLVWHQDDVAYLAAFSLYLSDWSENAGGYFAYKDEEDSFIGVGHIIEPRKNRLLLFQSSLNHAVTICASDAASDRLSLTGFVVRQSKAERLFETFMSDIERTSH